MSLYSRTLKENYTRIPNDILHHKDISLKEKGLWAYLNSKPDGWDFSSERIALENKENKDTIKRILKRLIELKLITRDRKSDGRYDYFLWDYSEKPQFENQSERKSHGAKINPISNTDLLNNTEFKKEEKVKKEISSEIKLLSEKVIEHLNNKTGNKFRANGKQVLELIKARVNDKYKLDDFIRVIDIKCEEWENDDKSFTWLRPSTLFGPKMETYAAQISLEDSEMAKSEREFYARQEVKNYLKKQDELFDH